MKKKHSLPAILPRIVKACAFLTLLAFAGCAEMIQFPPADQPAPGGGAPPQYSPQPGRQLYNRALYEGRAMCLRNSVLGPRGQCWSCPRNAGQLRRSRSGKFSCLRSGSTTMTRANKRRRNKRIGQGCPRGQFWDVKGGRGLLGACYSCPKGFIRTVTSVTSGEACFKSLKARYLKATSVMSFCRRPDHIFSSQGGGQCWSCPNGYRFSRYSVTNARACVRR